MFSVRLFYYLLLSSLFVSIKTACKTRTPCRSNVICSDQYTYFDEASSCTCICATSNNVPTTEICSLITEAHTRLADLNVINIQNYSRVLLMWNQKSDIDLEVQIKETNYRRKTDANNFFGQVTNPIEYLNFDRQMTPSGTEANVSVIYYADRGFNATSFTYYVIVEANHKRQIISGEFLSGSVGLVQYINITFF